MQYPITVPGFDLRNIVVQLGGIMSTPKILIDGEPAPKGPKTGQFLLRRNDGAEAIAQLRSRNFLDPIPQIVVDGKTYSLAEPLKWYQWLWGGLPFALAIIGGALGGLFGGIALFVNGRVFRSNLNPPLKYLVSAGVSILAVIGFFLAAVAFQLSITSLFAKPETIHSATGRFLVVAPTKLAETTQSVDVPNIGKTDVHNFTGQHGNAAYYISYSDYPVEIVQRIDPNKMLEGSRDGANQSINGKITADASILLGGYPGREFTMEGKDENGQSITIKSRIILVDNRLYQIMVVTPTGTSDNSSSNAFFQSFELIDD